ncbi:MAG: peptidylprolyl isomerase [Deltaproteobacteria bacterium]|nr:peptidylprolyl isomerase [Deltaproteobacteria bacterium]
MSQARNGDIVTVHYTVMLGNGHVVETSRERQPLRLTLGGGRLMPAVEEGIVGMEIGAKKTIRIPPENAFGLRREELVVDVAKDRLPPNISPAVGQRLQRRQHNDAYFKAVITSVNEDDVTLDANHPLAGNALLVDVELLEAV